MEEQQTAVLRMLASTADDVAPNIDGAGANLAVHGCQYRIHCTPLKIYLSSYELHIREAQDDSQLGHAKVGEHGDRQHVPHTE